MSVRSLRLFRPLAIAAAAAVLLSGCVLGGGGDSDSGGDEGAAEGPVTLVFRQNDPDLESTGVEEMVQQWNDENPDITVTLENAPWAEARQQFVREVPAREGPDIVQMGFVWTPDLARGGLLTDLTAYVEETPPGEGIDDFIGRDLATVDDKLYALPWTVDTGTIVYRKDVLDKAGVTSLPTTWAEFQDLAVQLSTDHNGDGVKDYGFCFNAGAPWFLFNAYLWSQGEDLVTGSGDSAEPGIDDAALAEAITYFNGFLTKGATPESNIAVREYGDPELVGGLQRGDCVMSFLPIGPYKGLFASDPNLPLASGPMPGGSEGSTSFLGGRALGISAATEHPDEAYQFASWMTQQQLFTELGYPWWPAQLSLIEQLDFPAPQSGFQEMLPKARTFADYLQTLVPIDGLSTVMEQQLSAVFSGTKAPEQASTDANAEIQQLIDQT